MKKTAALIIGILLICISFTAFAADDNYKYNELESLGIIPQGFANSDMTEALTREELAWMASSMLPGGQEEATDTRFLDVKADNIYSGAIAYLDSINIIHGVDQTRFDPKGSVSTDMFYKVLFEIIGYGDFAQMGGGYPEGYLSLARSFRSMREYTASGMILTRADAVELVHNVIFEEFGGLVYYYQDGELKTQTDSGDRFSILGKHLGISMYSGIAEDIDDEKQRLTLSSVSNEADTNAVIMSEGSTKTFKLSCDSPYKYEKAPVVVFADLNDNIVHIDIADNAEIKYGYIYSVNDNVNKNSHYSISGVNTLTLLDDEEEYKVSGGALMRYNNEMSNAPARMVGNFARLILTDGKISFIELWNLSEGGLIAEVQPNYISYQCGNSKRKINDLDNYNYRYVFADNEPASEKVLAAGMVFDWYEKDDYIVFVASSKHVTDELLSVNDDFVEIGNSLYIADTVYYSGNGVDYKANDYSDAVRSIVTAYIGPDGYVRYIKTDESTSVLKTFHGAVYGGDSNSFSGTGYLKVLHLDAGLEKKEYTIDKKTVFGDGLSLDTISENCSNTDLSDDVYVFDVTASGTVKKISKPLPVIGYVEGGRSRAQISKGKNEQVPAVSNPPYVTVAGKRFHFSESTLMLALYELNGEIEAGPVTYLTSMAERYDLSLILDFYGTEELIDEPVLIVVTGTLDRLGSKLKTGFVTGERSNVLDQYGNVGQKIKVLTSTAETESFVTPEYAKTINDFSVINYASDCKFGASELYVIEEVVDLSADYADWNIGDYTASTAKGLYRGIVERLGSYTLWLDDGTAFTLGNSGKIIALSLDETDPKERFTMISKDEIYPGDEIVFLYSGSLVNVIIRIE